VLFLVTHTSPHVAHVAGGARAAATAVAAAAVAVAAVAAVAAAASEVAARDDETLGAAHRGVAHLGQLPASG